MKRFTTCLILAAIVGCSGGDGPISPKAEGPADPKIQRAGRGTGGTDPGAASTSQPLSAN